MLQEFHGGKLREANGISKQAKQHGCGGCKDLVYERVETLGDYRRKVFCLPQSKEVHKMS